METLQGRIRAAETRGRRSDSFGRRKKRLGEVVDARRARARVASRVIAWRYTYVRGLFGQPGCSSEWVKNNIIIAIYQISLEQVSARRQGPPCLSPPSPLSSSRRDFDRARSPLLSEPAEACAVHQTAPNGASCEELPNKRENSCRPAV